MSKGDLVAIIESQKTVIQRFYRLLPVENKKLSPGEKLAWAVAKPLIDKETPNAQGLIRIPIDEIAEKIGMSDSSASRYIQNICERFDATHTVEPYVTKKGQQCNLTYIDPSDPIWATSPDELPLPAEKERTINGNECPHCKSTGTLHTKKRHITEQEIAECDVCGYTKVYPVVQVNEPLEPVEYCPPKKALQAGEPFPKSSEHEKGLQAGDLFSAEKVENLHCLPVYTGRTAAQELQALPQWVVWRYGPRKVKGKRDKKPFDAKLEAPRIPCDYTNPASWAPHDQALAKLIESQSWARPYDGIGFSFKEGGGLVGADRDGSTAPLLPTYGETSVSGTGQHQIARGTLPRNLKCSEFGIELYDHKRFFTWTGDHLPGTPITIEDCQEAIDALYKELAPDVQVLPTRSHDDTAFTCSRSDDEILEKARSAPNGAKFRALWEGNIAGYGSQSEADLALCRMLAYWADNNVSTIERLFEHSGLKREKWDRADYRERTINRALGLQTRRAS